MFKTNIIGHIIYEFYFYLNVHMKILKENNILKLIVF